MQREFDGNSGGTGINGRENSGETIPSFGAMSIQRRVPAFAGRVPGIVLSQELTSIF